jgi:hypothetical protein
MHIPMQLAGEGALLCEISGFYSVGEAELCLLGCDAICSGRILLSFRSKVPPHSSGVKIEVICVSP